MHLRDARKIPELNEYERKQSCEMKMLKMKIVVDARSVTYTPIVKIETKVKS